MLENLASLNQIGEAVALEDFERVKQVASGLRASASVLQKIDMASLGVDPGRDAAFDAYLEAQKQAAKAIAAAANGQDGAAVFLAVQQLTTDACLACHKNFRERENLMRTSVLFMTTFLHAWQDINRGVMLDDLELVARRAYEIQSVGRVLGWDQVIEATFGVSDATEQGEFREFLRRMTAQAGRIEKAAAENRVRDIAEASRRMWTEGCLSCHEQFREGN
jgi:cytochrome c556